MGVSRQSFRNPCWPKSCLFAFPGWEPQGAGSTFVTLVLGNWGRWWEPRWDETKLDSISSLYKELLVDFNCVVSPRGLSSPISLILKVTWNALHTQMVSHAGGKGVDYKLWVKLKRVLWEVLSDLHTAVIVPRGRPFSGLGSDAVFGDWSCTFLHGSYSSCDWTRSSFNSLTDSCTQTYSHFGK